MGEIKNISITKGSVGETEVTFTVNCLLNTNTAAGWDANSEEIDSIQLQGPGTGTLSSNYTINQGNASVTGKITGLNGGTTYSPTIQVNFKGTKTTISIDEEFLGYYFMASNDKGGYDRMGDYSDLQNAVDAQIKCINNGKTVKPTAPGTGVAGKYYNGKNYYFYTNSREVQTSNTVEVTDDATQTFTCYTHPSDFCFSSSHPNYATSSLTWEVSAGLQTLLDNIYKFNYQAYRWQLWSQCNVPTGSNVPQVDSCTGFYKGKLTADMLNGAYTYLGLTGGYKTGDKVVASMFTRLEEKIKSY